MAENGKKAIEAAQAQPFDCFIIDLVMPDLDGWEVLRVAQQIQPFPRVIVITAHGKEDTRKVAEEKGAWAFVEKPFIIDHIKSLLKGVQLEKSKYRIN